MKYIICSNCGEQHPHHANDLCKNCYDKSRQHIPRKEGICADPLCPSFGLVELWARGMCRKCYMRHYAATHPR